MPINKDTPFNELLRSEFYENRKINEESQENNRLYFDDWALCLQ